MNFGEKNNRTPNQEEDEIILNLASKNTVMFSKDQLIKSGLTVIFMK